MIELLIFTWSYFCLSGIKDAILYSRLGADMFSWNEHLVYALERGVIMCAIIYATQVSLLDSIVVCFVGLLSFSFWHNGFYYMARKDVPGYRFNSNSTTSTAVFEFSWSVRLTMFIISISAYILYILWKLKK